MHAFEYTEPTTRPPMMLRWGIHSFILLSDLELYEVSEILSRAISIIFGVQRVIIISRFPEVRPGCNPLNWEKEIAPL